MLFPRCWQLLAGVLTILCAVPAHCAPVRWQADTLQLVRAGGNYARVARVDAQNIACIYERGAQVRLKRSGDNGQIWGDETVVAAVENYGAANPELLILPNGDWLCSFNGRPRRNSGLPFFIATCRSRDKGRTWSAPATIYRAGTSSGVGCWEPRAINAPGGTIQLYFANEAPYPATEEQEITRLISRDNGATWGAPQTLSLRAGHRDGMPVPLVLQNGKIVMAIEDNGLSGNFKPVIIEPQPDQFVDGASPHRWSALRTPLAPDVYAGAPYLAQMAGGTTILSAQLSLGGDIRNAQMAVWIGDANARDFTDLSTPFAGFEAGNQLWNALWVKDARHISALCSAEINGVFGVWNIVGIVGEAPAKVVGAKVDNVLH